MSAQPVDATPAERAVALQAIRRAGVELGAALETWTSGPRDRRQVFVAEVGSQLGRGDAYTTWVVSLAEDGSALAVECFRSFACRRATQL